MESESALYMGMSYYDYWDGDPEMFFGVARLFKRKRDERFSEMDTQAWLIGAYVLNAVSINFNAAFGKKGAPKQKYPEAPMFAEQNSEEAKMKKQEREMKRSHANFLAAVQMMGKQIKTEPR